jgi:hypothetical protein
MPRDLFALLKPQRTEPGVALNNSPCPSRSIDAALFLSQALERCPWALFQALGNSGTFYG